jgi:CRISPR/Cas system-associated protein Csx1
VNVASEMTSGMTMRCSGLYRNIERLAEKTSPPRKWLKSNSLGMLRHTAGCSFYQGELVLALTKSSLIEVDVSSRDNTAQALRAA